MEIFSLNRNNQIQLKWIWIFALITIIGLINFMAVATLDLAEYREVEIYDLFFELNGAYSFMVLLPLMFWLFRKFPVKKTNLLKSVPQHIFFGICIGVLHTFIMWSSRHAIFYIMDWGRFDYGIIEFRIIMEYSKIAVIYWAVMGIHNLAIKTKEMQEQKLQTSKLQNELVNARLSALQMQLNPHFLFNTLNMISSVMYEDLKKAEKMIASLSDLLRLTLNSGKNFNESLKDEIDKTKIYVEIMKARFQDRLTVDFEIEDNLLDAGVPPFILQPLIENSIKHSQEALKEISHIKVTAKRNGEKLLLMVEDNGPGINGTLEQNVNKGVGLSNISERLENLYGDEHTFRLENKQDKGVEAKIEIPLTFEGNNSSDE